MTGVHQDALELVLEDRPHGLPEHAGGLHRDLGHAERSEPVTQRQKPHDRSRELRKMLLSPAILAGHAHARGHLLLVNVQRRGTLDNRLHKTSRNAIGRIVAQGPLRTNESDRRARGNSPEPREDPHAKLGSGSQHQEQSGVEGDRGIIPDFQSPATDR